MSFHAMVIVNPASANGGTGKSWPEIRAALDKVLDRWDNEFTTEPGDATRIAREAVKNGYEMIVSIGGDGTMTEVVDGLFEPSEEGISDRLIRHDVLLAPVRAGTGGDFARMLGLPHRLPESVRHLTGPQTKKCDLGLVEFVGHEGKKRRAAFLNIASFGLSGVVDDKVNHTTKAFGGTATFFLGLTRALVSYQPEAVRIRVDGEPFYEGTMVTCAVANGQYFGGGMRFAKDAEIDDGLFDVVVQTKSGLKEILSVADLYSGRMSDWSSVRRTRGKIVEAEPGDDSVRGLLDVDGEQPGRLPAKFWILPGAVRIKIP
jgi:YegS/Rv2252/BmrU family lipid kinase